MVLINESAMGDFRNESGRPSLFSSFQNPWFQMSRDMRPANRQPPSPFSAVWEEMGTLVGKGDFLRNSCCCCCCCCLRIPVKYIFSCYWTISNQETRSLSLLSLRFPQRRAAYLVCSHIASSPHLAPQTFLAALPRKMVCLRLLRGSCAVQLPSPPVLAPSRLPWREYSYSQVV